MKVFVQFLMVAAALGAEGAEKSGRLEGTIVSRDASKNQLTVAHGDVAGLMSAMTMPYEVRGQHVASLPKDGAKITAVLHESNGALWLTDVKASGMAPMQHEQMQMPMQHEHASMPNMTSDATSALLMRQASGTSMNPGAAPMHMTMTMHGDWMLMLHGAAFVSQVVQSGPRGGDKLFSTNWAMGMAERPLGGGRLMFRSMLSLEPLTVGRKYPELFQTGEKVIDGQHPHDFFMEVAAEYARPLTANTIGYIYAAPFGDPALGPVAYPHRASAAEIPQATLSHHVQDSTHIAGSVVTIGTQSGMFGYAVSGFHGREPDQHRWDIDTGRIDSWSARVTFDPTPNVTAQISTGHLTRPEELEPGNIQRTTASIAYSTAAWNTSLIVGHNDRSEGRTTNAFVAESVFKFGGVNYLTGRGEIVDKDELIAGENVRVKALTIGYSRDVFAMTAVGANVTKYSIPDSIKPPYGSSPRSLYIFVRWRGSAR